MRNEAGWLSLFCVAVITMFAAGCSSIDMNTTATIGAPTFPPTDPALVQVLQAEPTEPYTEVGQVTLEADSNTPTAQVEAKLQQGAAKLGANAVFVTQDKVQAVGAMAMGGPRMGGAIEPEIGRVIRAKAIRTGK